MSEVDAFLTSKKAYYLSIEDENAPQHATYTFDDGTTEQMTTLQAYKMAMANLYQSIKTDYYCKHFNENRFEFYRNVVGI